VLAAQKPNVPNAPTTTIAGSNVQITWTLSSDGGSAVTSFSVRIRQVDEVTFTPDLTDCNGSNQSIISALTCSVPISSLLLSPYNLPWGSSIYAVVSATNIYGTSALSTPGNGAVILRIPDPPINLMEDTTNKSPTTIGL